MDSDYKEQKKAELARAQQQCSYLWAQHKKSCRLYDAGGDLASDFEYTTFIGLALMDSQDDLKSLQREVDEANAELYGPKQAQPAATTGQDFGNDEDNTLYYILIFVLVIALFIKLFGA